MATRKLTKSRVFIVSQTGTGTSQTYEIDSPSGDPVDVRAVYVDYTTDATVGDRQIVFEVLDDASTLVYEMRVGVVQAASLSNYKYLLAPGVSDMTTRRDTNYCTTPISPGVELRDGWTLKVHDNNTVSASDTLDVYFYLAR